MCVGLVDLVVFITVLVAVVSGVEVIVFLRQARFFVEDALRLRRGWGRCFHLRFGVRVVRERVVFALGRFGGMR